MCLLPRSLKMLINLAISCPMARPESDGARTLGGLRGPRSSPGAALTSFAYEVSEAARVYPLRGLGIPWDAGPRRAMSYLSRALEVQGKRGPEFTSSPLP